jgi:hypothetical protein
MRSYTTESTTKLLLLYKLKHFDLSVSKKETFSTSWTHQTLTGGKPGNNVFKLKDEPHEIDIFVQRIGKFNQHFLHASNRADIFQNLNLLWF